MELQKTTNSVVINTQRPWYTGPINLTESQQTELTAWIVISTTVSFLSSINDFLLLLVTWPRRSAPSSINFLIFHYVLVDLSINLLCMPALIFMVQVTEHGYTLAANICDWTHSTLNVGVGVLSWCDASLAVNRCIALFFPHSYKNWCTTSVNVTMLIFPWILCSALNFLISLRIEGSFLLTSLGYCYTNSAGFAKYFAVFMTYIPFGIVAVSACFILWKSFSVTHNRVYNVEGTAFERLQLRRLHLAKILLTTIFISAFCSISAWASMYFTKTFDTSPVSFLWLRLLWATQFSVPPFFLFVLNSEYRVRIKSIIKGNKLFRASQHRQVTDDTGLPK